MWYVFSFSLLDGEADADADDTMRLDGARSKVRDSSLPAADDVLWDCECRGQCLGDA